MGNTSLSIIPVPNFYMNRTLYDMETFKIKKKKYFKEKDLFQKTKDLNLSNNPRLNGNKFEEFNKTKYVPPYRSKSQNKVDTLGTFSFHNFTQYMETGENKLKNKDNQVYRIPKEITEFKKYEEYMKKHQSSFENPDFGQALRNNINNIVDRINSNFEIDKWSSSKLTQPEYMTQINSRITLDDFNENENESTKFQNTLKGKISSLKLDMKDKEKILKTFIKNTENNMEKISKQSTTDKFFNSSKISLINASILPNSSTRLSSQMNTNENKHSTTSMPSLYNNTAYNSFNKLSETKNEFSQMNAEKVSFRRKEKIEKDEIDPRIYNAFQHRNVFCENYNTYGGIFEKSHENNELKQFYK